MNQSSEGVFFSWHRDRRFILGFVGVYCAVIAIDSIAVVWGDRRPVGSFFEEFVAGVAYWTMVFGSFGFGIWAGVWTFEKASSKILGWIVGIAVFVTAGLIVSYAASAIPGVGWRFDRLLDSNEDY